ncbi:hypothetical protein DVT68_14965 [Dyella solisilvae]|uniref:DUF5666 domain-containing protein n=1 Tax=Dyella solisilvae TaxID=1920168 RepID=A0A370K4M1_9GAMM|nr:hypothetical protein [Dyella solisilvae]RDI97594.1 hypothetical protein DVT68_14965 [Dyella solisilvae]
MTKPHVSPLSLLAAALAVALALPMASQAQEVAHSSTVHTTAGELARQEKTLTATVVSIDHDKRLITLRGPSGHEETIEAGPEVKNFDQIKPGDQVSAHFQAALALQILPADGHHQLGTEVEGGTTTAPKGSTPGMTTGHSITVTTKLTALDLKNHTVTLTGEDGHERVIEVKDPERQAQLNRLKVGDLVSITYVEALAITVTPQGKAGK